jgi:hypothetical protein
MFYDWNIIPIGQALWLQELESYGLCPALQSPTSHSLGQVLTQAGNRWRGLAPVETRSQ